MADDLHAAHARRERLELERIEHALRARHEQRRAAPLRAACRERALTASERRLLDGALIRGLAHEQRLIAIAQELIDLDVRIDRATLTALATRGDA